MTATAQTNLNPCCTIVICAFNAEKFIEQTVHSCLEFGENSKINLLIVDDCSTDKTQDVLQFLLKRYPAHIKLITNEQNIGLTKSLVKATSLVETKYFARLDAEDLNFKHRVKEQVSVLEKVANAICCSCDYVLINPKGRVVREVSFDITKTNLKAEMLQKGNPFCHSTLVFNTELFKRLGGYNINLEFRQDLDLLIRIEDSEHRHLHLPKKLVGYRMLADGISTKIEATLYGYLIRNYYSDTKLKKKISVEAYIEKYFSSRLPLLESLLLKSVKTRRELANFLWSKEGKKFLILLRNIPFFIFCSCFLLLEPAWRLILDLHMRNISK